MVQLYLGESRDWADGGMQQNRKMEVWILPSAVRVMMMTRCPTRAERVHETEENGATHIYKCFHLHMLYKSDGIVLADAHGGATGGPPPLF